MNQRELLKKIQEAADANLTELDLSNNNLTEMPKEIAQLNNLTTLDLSHNQCATFPNEIAQLTNLIELKLSFNHLNKVPKEIAQLTSLTKLDLSYNQLTELPKEVAQLTNLIKLELSDNQLTELPKEVTELAKLVILGISNNSLVSLPDGFGRLSNLLMLYIDRNKFTHFPDEILRLTNIGLLEFSHNKLVKVPKAIAQLTNLSTLYLSNNQLTELPQEITQLSKLTKLDLRGNPLSIPPEILNNSDKPATIFNYILQNQSEQRRRLNEAKVLVVGQGTVGKTSLIKRLIDNTYNPQENKTEGIDIRRWHVDVGGENVCLNVWDFGGQEIMHATHQFFLTKRSLYLLVLDSRQEEAENRLEYWLKIIQSFGSDSPVLVVCNKADQHHLELDKHGLQEKYANIQGFVETSCEKETVFQQGMGIVELKEAIAQQIAALGHIHDELPATWFAVKERLEQMPQNYIPASEYQQICQNDRVTDALSQRTLLRFLHDLGIILNYDDDPRLQDTNILNPEWVTNGVYKILNSHQMSEGKGKLRRPLLSQILDPQTYPPAKHEFILEMMRKFELCFDLDEGGRGQTFLIPDLLRKEEIYGRMGGYAGVPVSVRRASRQHHFPIYCADERIYSPEHLLAHGRSAELRGQRSAGQGRSGRPPHYRCDSQRQCANPARTAGNHPQRLQSHSRHHHGHQGSGARTRPRSAED